MSASSTAESGQQRLDPLARIAAGSDADPVLDGLARVAALVCDTPIAIITVTEGSRERTKACFGAGLDSSACCTHRSESDAVLVVPDMLLDAQGASCSFSTAGKPIRFFARVLLTTAPGPAVGTLCVMDHRPRSLDEREIEILRLLARHVAGHLELRRELSVASAGSMLRVPMAAADVSHGLRTPLTSIRGSLALLASGYAGEMPASAREMLAIAERNSVRLGSFIEDMLDERAGKERAKS